MPYCPRCGVELESDKSECPLCGTEIEHGNVEQDTNLYNYPHTEIKPKNDFRQIAERKKYVWELVSIFYLISIISVLAIDFSRNRSMTWSFYPLTAILSVWACLTLMFFLGKSRILIAGYILFFLSLYLFLIDFYVDGINWFLYIALPVLILLLVVVSLVGFTISRFKSNGLNTVGAILIGISLFCTGLENILSFYLKGSFSFTWSTIVGFSLTPISGFLIYLHYRFTSGKKYEGWLHF